MKRFVGWAIAGAVLILALVGFVLVQPYQLRGSTILPLTAAPEIALGDFRLSHQQGKVVVLAFGYTTCPDICPATLGEFKRLLAGLGKEAEDVEMVFVTVDPQRDTAERIQAYTAGFDTRIRGLSGSENELALVWQAYGVTRIIREVGSKAGYLVDHSTRMYVIDRAGNLRVTYAFGTPVEDLLSDLRFLVKES
jgi:protein SCO1